MFLRILLLSLLLSFNFSAKAQKKAKAADPEVLVYGNGLKAFAAAMQSAQSGVETLWLLSGPEPEELLLSKPISTIASARNTESGAWRFLLDKLREQDTVRFKRLDDVRPAISRLSVLRIVKASADTMRRLTLRPNSAVQSISRSGKYWELELSSKEKIKVRSIVDATDKPLFFQDALQASAGKKGNKMDAGRKWAPADIRLDYGSPLYRTAVVVENREGQPFFIPLQAVLPDSATHFFSPQSFNLYTSFHSGTERDIPFQMHYFQALGAAAAYAAFFKTVTDEVPVRTLQGELIAFGNPLIPFADVSRSDRHWDAIQRVGACGLLPGILRQEDQEEVLVFSADDSVRLSALRDPVNAFYNRSQIWFLKQEPDGLDDLLKLNTLISLVQFIGNRGPELPKEISTGWTKRFGFEGEYDGERVLNRRQIAVLLDTYLSPFHHRVRLDGSLQF